MGYGGYGGYHTGAGVPEITGAAPGTTGAVHPAVASALAAVANTPHFQALVAQHAQAMGLAAPNNLAAAMPASHGSTSGAGPAYGGGDVQVQERPLRDIREFSLGFFQSGIANGSNFNVVTRPQVVFRGERLVVPSSPSGFSTVSIAAAFTIVDIKVGNRSQLVAATALPAQAFVETAVGVRLSLDTAAIAQDVTIIVNNVAGGTATFQAIIFGTAAQ